MGAIHKADLYPGFNLNCPAINAPIEPGIMPVCEVLNSLPDVHTLWSCEGHADLPTKPYVVFIAQQDLAFRVSKLLDGYTGLNYRWRLIATFRLDGSLQYILEPNDYRLSDRSVLWFRKLFDRKEMDNELRCLAELIRNIKAQ